MSIFKDIIFRLEYAAVLTFRAFIRLFPLDAAAEAVGAAVAFAAPYSSLHKRALANLAAAFPDKPEAERKQIALAMWRNTGRTIAEMFLLERILADDKRIEVEQCEMLEGILRGPVPAIAVTLHMGNWEIAGMACSKCGGKLTGVYRPMRNPYLDRLLRETRTPYYPGGLLFKGREAKGAMPVDAASIATIKVLKNGGHLGLVCDQTDRTAPFTVPFFGHEAKFTPAAAILARHAEARIWLARCRRLDNGSRFIVDVRELPVERTWDRNADLHKMTAAMAQQFENWIRETPEQWMWWARRSIAD